jgi:hypothetical protein
MLIMALQRLDDRAGQGRRRTDPGRRRRARLSRIQENPTMSFSHETIEKNIG